MNKILLAAIIVVAALILAATAYFLRPNPTKSAEHRITGQWSGTMHIANKPPVQVDLSFNADKTARIQLTGPNPIDATGHWSIAGNPMDLEMILDKPLPGSGSSSINWGINDITDTELHLIGQSTYGLSANETYIRKN